MFSTSLDPQIASPARGNGRVVLQDGRQSLLFQDPAEIVTADNAADVEPLLQYVTGQVERNGYYAAGFLTYEAAAAYALDTHPRSDQNLPLAWFGLYEQAQTLDLAAIPDGGYEVGQWTPLLGRAAYGAAIAAIKSHIAQGHTYQVNYTLPLRAAFSGDPWALYRDLAQAQRAHYMAFVDLGRHVICSASPELFFERDGELLLSKPMKGTAPRGRTLAEDRAQMQWLQTSEKNRAENVMIVDMIRNDFGRIADVGSVQVPELFTIERYPTLLQMTSTVTARSQVSLPQIMRAMFPCASITGAPKVRTMEIIRELEPQPRGVYTGAIGFLTPDQRAVFNVAIRTVVIDRQREQATYGVGGGIVWDSEADQEYDECLLKAQVLVRRQPSFELLETLRWSPEEGYFLLDLHLQRVAESAAYFDFTFDRAATVVSLLSAAAGFTETMRVRLLLSEQGEIAVQSSPLPEPPERKPLRVALATKPVQSDNIWLYHKTTHRRVYEDALSQSPAADDVILWNEKGELTETTKANLVLDLDGSLVTPPLSCGLLAGTFRRFLLDNAQLQEQTITLAELQVCRKIYLINSVRLWQDVMLIEP